jgi:ribosomal protein L13E
MEFYSLVLKKKIQIPDSKVKTVVKKGRKFAVGSYEAKGKKYEAWRILGKA